MDHCWRGTGRGRWVVQVICWLFGVWGSFSFADIIPANRAAVWQGNAGVDGGIPNVTTIYATLTTANTLADINNAIQNCPSNQVVQLGAGTYNLAGGITLIQRNGVVLRGQGTNTILKFTGNPYLGNILVEGAWQSAIWNGVDGLVNWTGGYALGATNITLASTAGLGVGSVIGSRSCRARCAARRSRWATT